MKLKIFVLATLSGLLLLLQSGCSALGANDPLAGTSWTLTSIGGKGLVPGSNITLEFKDGQASGNAGCNSYGGGYQVNGNKVEFQQMASTLMACADSDMMVQESAYLGFLGKAQSFELADGQLQIYRSDGEALTFVPQK